MFWSPLYVAPYYSQVVFVLSRKELCSPFVKIQDQFKGMKNIHYSGLLTKRYHSQDDLIWPDGPFNDDVYVTLSLCYFLLCTVPDRVSPFRFKKFLAYKRNKANLDPFHMCFTISL
jgi:hypothetical protein